MGKIIAVVSGKGGTGKSTAAAALSCALAELGRRVIAVDADADLRNLDLCLGLSDAAVWDYGDVLEGRTTADAARIPSPQYPGLSLLAAPLEPVEGLPALLDSLRSACDYCIVDHAGGIRSCLHEAAAADRALVVSGTDACSHRDASRLAQLLREQGMADVRLLVNRVSRSYLRSSRSTLDDTIDRVGLRLIGYVPEDRRVALSLAAGVPLLTQARSPAAAAFRRIAKRIDGQKVPVAQ